MLSEIWEMWEGLFSIENLKCSHQLSPGLGLAEGTTCTAHHGPGRPGETPKTFQLDGSHQKSVNKKILVLRETDSEIVFFIIQVVSQLKFCGIEWIQLMLRCWEEGAAAEPGERI